MSYDNWLTTEPDHWYSCAKCGAAFTHRPFEDEDDSGKVWLYCSEDCRERH